MLVTDHKLKKQKRETMSELQKAVANNRLFSLPFLLAFSKVAAWGSLWSLSLCSFLS